MTKTKCILFLLLFVSKMSFVDLLYSKVNKSNKKQIEINNSLIQILETLNLKILFLCKIVGLKSNKKLEAYDTKSVNTEIKDILNNCIIDSNRIKHQILILKGKNNRK